MRINNKITRKDIYEFALHVSVLGILSLMNLKYTVLIFILGLVLPDFLWVFYFFGLMQETTLKRWKKGLHIFAMVLGLLMLAGGKVTLFLAPLTHIIIDVMGRGEDNGRKNIEKD